jgi:hypothetical protein
VKTIVVRYETKPERADENQRLAEKVFAALHELAPEGFGYATFRLEDGVSFIHVVREMADADIALNDVPAFQAFLDGIADRCVQPPVAKEATIVGSYHFFDD